MQIMLAVFLAMQEIDLLTACVADLDYNHCWNQFLKEF